MRAKKLKFFLCKGWVKGSGTGSAKAGTLHPVRACTHMPLDRRNASTVPMV